MKKTLLFILSSILLYSCGILDNVNLGKKSSVELRVIAQAQADSEYELTISGPGMATIGPDRYQGGQTVRLSVPEGANRCFELKRYDEIGTLTDSAVLVQDVGSGVNKIDITVKPLFRILYEPNGGTGTAPQDTGYYPTGSVAFVAKSGPDLQKEGHTFLNWNTEEDGSGTSYPIDAELIIGSENVTLYAQWTQNPTFRIHYKGNGHTEGTAPVDPNEYETGTTFSVLDIGTMKKEGYTFSEWNMNRDGNGASYGPGTDYTIGSADDTLWAQWETNQYTVEFNSNEGSAVSSETVDYNKKITEPDNPDKAGYEFKGWYTDSSCIEAWNFDTDLVVKDTVLYAKWKTAVEVTFNTTGGSSVSPQRVVEGDPIVRPEDPSRACYSFAGWFTDLNYSQQWDFSNTVSSAMELYAKWKWGDWFIFASHFDTLTTATLDTNDYRVEENVYFDSTSVLFTLGEADTLEPREAGIGFMIDNEKITLLQDCDSISFSARASQATSVRFQVNTADIENYESHGKEISIGADEMNISIPIASLEQPEWSTNKTLDLSKTETIYWTIPTIDNIHITEGYLSIWNVRLH